MQIVAAVVASTYDVPAKTIIFVSLLICHHTEIWRGIALVSFTMNRLLFLLNWKTCKF